MVETVYRRGTWSKSTAVYCGGVVLLLLLLLFLFKWPAKSLWSAQVLRDKIYLTALRWRGNVGCQI